MSLHPLLPLTLLMLLGAGLSGSAAATLHGAPALRIATWNMQWLVSAETARQARLSCRSGRRATLPCDVARGLARDSADIARLAAYARRLDADVIALQEVENANIARRVLPGYLFCLSEGSGVQQVGFAVRPQLPHQCGPAVEALSGGRGRPGMALTLQAPGLPAIELLALHLKSGCARDPLRAGPAACKLLARQAEELGRWIAGRAASGSAFIVLGDLNRGGLPRNGDDFWNMLDPDLFEAAAAQLPFRNCMYGAPYTDFIDHVLVSRTLLPWLAQPAFEQLRFQTADVVRYRLSDHCPISVLLKPDPPYSGRT